MRRLYWRIYAGFLLVVVLFALMVGAARWLDDDDERERLIQALSATVVDLLPPPEAPAEELAATLERLATRFRADAGVYDADRNLIADSGTPVPRPSGEGTRGWVRDDRGHGFELLLPDGRWLVVLKDHDDDDDGPGEWIGALALLALAIAIGAYPLARRVTRSVEHLQTQVEALGAGDLSARVEVRGRDEVAQLARAFNRSAERIEQLVEAQRSTLASASHELRSPLVRIRMALDLAEDGLRPDLRARMEGDIAELDELIEELLLASRLQMNARPGPAVELDLLALLAEEAARVDAGVSGEAMVFTGDPRLLRRMLRNLLENAARHGGGTPVEASVRRVVQSGGAPRVQVLVEDRGPGIAADVRERIFEPFYRPPGMREGEDPGVGLGLALVRDIAHHYGGQVSCEDRDGGGTVLRVWLPLA